MLCLESQSSASRRMQLYPRASDLFWPGHLHGTGCLSARAMDIEFPTVVWRFCLGVRLAVTPPILARVERQIQECIGAFVVEEFKHENCPCHYNPCFLVAKPGSTAIGLIVDYGEVNKKAQKHSGSISNTENSVQRIAKSQFKMKMDKRSVFWQVDLARQPRNCSAL